MGEKLRRIKDALVDILELWPLWLLIALIVFVIVYCIMYPNQCQCGNSTPIIIYESSTT